MFASKIGNFAVYARVQPEHKVRIVNAWKKHGMIIAMSHNKYLLGAMLLSFLLTIPVIYLPGINTTFKLTPLSVGNLIIATALSFSAIPIVEAVKFVQRHK